MNKGGHAVPDEKVKARIPGVLQLFKQVFSITHYVIRHTS